jgi:hypothetical protein
MHFQITLTVVVLGRRWCRDQRGVNDGSLAHQQAFTGKVSVDFIEDAVCQLVVLQRRRNFNSVVASGRDSCVRSMPTKARIA